MYKHYEGEILRLREEYYEWYFDPFREGTHEKWAKEHGVTGKTLTNWRKRPEFVERINNFRETYRESSDSALQNLIRFANDENPRVAIPALKITADVMGWNAPTQVQHSGEGMTLFQYLDAINKAQQGQVVDTTAKALPEPEPDTEPVVEFLESDPWETSEPEIARMN